MKKIIYILLIIPIIVSGQTGKFNEHTYQCLDTIERPFILYTPTTINKTQKRPLLVYLHGAISNKSLKKDPLAYMKKSKLIKLAEKGGFYLMYCYGQKGATWFDPVGMDMILKEIEIVASKYAIHKDKIFLSGFSDGGSGALYMSMVHPEPFAGFIAMNGHLKVADKLGTYALYPANSNHKPTYIINTKKDMLYPIKQIKPAISYLQKFNTAITFSEVDGNHDMSYLQKEQKKLIDFITTTTRRNKYKISWETSDLSNNSYEWISILEMDTKTKDAHPNHTPYSLEIFNDKAVFGIKYDYSFRGPGLKVSDFKSDTCTAKKIGIKKGDIILMMEKDTMTSPYAPYFYIANKLAGDQTSLTIKRGDNKIKIEGAFNQGHTYSVFNHKKTTARVWATIEEETLLITTSRTKKIAIRFSDIKNKTIRKLIINGKKYSSSYKGTQEITIKQQ
ncbi:phospholipase [Aquimarina sp. TRL1]|uniref:phospholipase n=1 Tax=Aquimarina sp. (strain TRL1) TaxID=2736252 RepID=UPI00158B467B|nr:phospholipase [Aquimarina sp. TRL1]QKX06029.1 phospholipase [Aquimarina sp. TRL1]